MKPNGLIVCKQKQLRRKRRHALPGLAKFDVRTTPTRELLKELGRRNMSALAIVERVQGAQRWFESIVSGDRIVLRAMLQQLQDKIDPEEGEAWKA